MSECLNSACKGIEKGSKSKLWNFFLTIFFCCFRFSAFETRCLAHPFNPCKNFKNLFPQRPVMMDYNMCDQQQKADEMG